MATEQKQTEQTKEVQKEEKKPQQDQKPQQRKAKQEKKPQQEKKQQEKKQPPQQKKAGDKKETGTLGIETKKKDDLAEWYAQVITRSEMLDYYDISGCYILRPWAFNIWERIQEFFDAEIKKLGVMNAYFPIFVSKRALGREESELHGFEAEVAWVTRSGETELHEPIAVRPTSETVMYPAFKNWIHSHRDLPLKVNQWCNVVRWEFKRPVPFIRTREFLWQEGHSAFSTKEEAEKEVRQILDLYKRVYEDLLAVPVTQGCKSEHEKFAGALYTTTVEAFIPANGRSVQAATSHCLGQTFAKMFEVEFLDEKKEKQYAWQNSWGLTTRTLGVMTLVHGDDNGLILPPRVAPIQVVVVPLHFKDKPSAVVDAKAVDLANCLRARGLRVHLDDRELYTPGWKFSHWELKGVPLRVEVGPRDVEGMSCLCCRRDNRAKEQVPWNNLADRAAAILDDIQASLLRNARAERESRTKLCKTWEEFMKQLNSRNICLVPWCKVTECEEKIKIRSAQESVAAAAASSTTSTSAAKQQQQEQEEEANEGLTGSAKSLCVPFEQPAPMQPDTPCFQCGKPAVAYTLFGRSY